MKTKRTFVGLDITEQELKVIDKIQRHLMDARYSLRSGFYFENTSEGKLYWQLLDRQLMHAINELTDRRNSRT